MSGPGTTSTTELSETISSVRLPAATWARLDAAGCTAREALETAIVIRSALDQASRGVFDELLRAADVAARTSAGERPRRTLRLAVDLLDDLDDARGAIISDATVGRARAAAALICHHLDYL